LSWLPEPDPGASCLVTGASAGIGAAIATELATRGRGVTLVARRGERLEEMAKRLEVAHGVRAEALACDLGDGEARSHLPERIAELGLRVEVLVQSAGLGTYGEFTRLERRRELEQVRVMSEAVVDLAAMFVPKMAERRSGGVLTVASGLGLAPAARYATYSATKAFCVAFGDSLHMELRGQRVAVSTVCPGPVSSEFFEANGPQPAQKAPGLLWRSPEQVARSAVDGLERNRRVVIPGVPMRAMMAGSRLVPRGLSLRMLDRAFK
jgi:short-subunit dehydrogenase